MRKRKKKRKCIICRQRIDAKHVIDGICTDCSPSSVTKSHEELLLYNRKGIKPVRKICPNCRIKKELETGFGKRGGQHYNRWYNSWCLECRRKYNREYREKNKEKAIAYSREYRKKEGYKERNAAYMREYRRKKRHSLSSKAQ